MWTAAITCSSTWRIALEDFWREEGEGVCYGQLVKKVVERSFI